MDELKKILQEVGPEPTYNMVLSAVLHHVKINGVKKVAGRRNYKEFMMTHPRPYLDGMTAAIIYNNETGRVKLDLVSYREEEEGYTSEGERIYLSWRLPATMADIKKEIWENDARYIFYTLFYPEGFTPKHTKELREIAKNNRDYILSH